jgi:hypothetical protein
VYDAQWGKLEAGTKSCYTSALRHWLTYVDQQRSQDDAFDGVAHPIPKVARFFDHLLVTTFQTSKDAVAALGNVRKVIPATTVHVLPTCSHSADDSTLAQAMLHLRLVQRGIPNPTGFTEHPLLQACIAEARKRRGAARNR